MCHPASLNESVMSIPDSTATSEQLTLKRKIERVSFFKTQVKDNRLELTVGKEYFIDNDIPVRYYELINERIKETNAGIDQLEAEGINVDLAAGFEEERKAYEAYIEAFERSGISLEKFNDEYNR